MRPDTRFEEKTSFHIKERIFAVIQQSDGLSISDVSRALQLHYTTASKYIAVLEAERRVYYRQVGMAKLFKSIVPLAPPSPAPPAQSQQPEGEAS